MSTAHTPITLWPNGTASVLVGKGRFYLLLTPVSQRPSGETEENLLEVLDAGRVIYSELMEHRDRWLDARDYLAEFLHRVEHDAYTRDLFGVPVPPSVFTYFTDFRSEIFTFIDTHSVECAVIMLHHLEWREATCTPDQALQSGWDWSLGESYDTLVKTAEFNSSAQSQTGSDS